MLIGKDWKDSVKLWSMCLYLKKLQVFSRLNLDWYWKDLARYIFYHRRYFFLITISSYVRSAFNSSEQKSELKAGMSEWCIEIQLLILLSTRTWKLEWEPTNSVDRTASSTNPIRTPRHASKAALATVQNPKSYQSYRANEIPCFTGFRLVRL